MTDLKARSDQTHERMMPDVLTYVFDRSMARGGVVGEHVLDVYDRTKALCDRVSSTVGEMAVKAQKMDSQDWFNIGMSLVAVPIGLTMIGAEKAQNFGKNILRRKTNA